MAAARDPAGTMTDTTPGPGDRQQKETAPAYEAFRAYLEMGPARSTAKVAQALGKSKTLTDRWCKRWSWVDRVREFESQAHGAKDDAHLDAIAERSRRQAQIAQLHGEASMTVTAEVLRRLQTEDGQRELGRLPLDRLLGLEATLGRMHNRAVMSERLALGLTTDQPGSPTPRSEAEAVARRMTDDELEDHLAGVDQLAVKREQKRQREQAAS